MEVGLSPPIPHETRRLVIELPSWIGDAVMATPVLRAAREHCPDARITGLLRVGIDDLLAGLPYLDELVVVRPKGLGGVWRTAGAVRRCHAEAIVLLPNSLRSALGARLSGTPIRVGYDRDHRGPLLTHRLRHDSTERPIPMVDYYIQLARFAFGQEEIEDRLELCVTDDARVEADKLLGADCGPFVLLNPGGNKTQKCWPTDRFGGVASCLAKSHSLRVVVNGAPGESRVVREVVAGCPDGSINLVERGVTLSSLKGVVDRAALLITNDTGTRHIAAALGTPTVTLFGPTDHRWTTLHSVKEHLLTSEPFLPERLVADDHPKACPVDRIPVEDVLFAAIQLIDGRG